MSEKTQAEIRRFTKTSKVHLIDLHWNRNTHNGDKKSLMSLLELPDYKMALKLSCVCESLPKIMSFFGILVNQMQS